jgi:hypothetical protein
MGKRVIGSTVPPDASIVGRLVKLAKVRPDECAERVQRTVIRLAAEQLIQQFDSRGLVSVRQVFKDLID